MAGKTSDLDRRISPKSLSTEELDAILAESLELDDSKTDFNYLYSVAEEYSTREGAPRLSPERAQELYKERLEPLMQPKNKAAGKSKSVKLHTLRVAIIAAVIAALLAGTALAIGTDFFKMIFNWGDEQLTFKIFSSGDAITPAEDSQEHIELPEELKPLQEALEERGITASLLPTYFPEEYETLNTEIYDNDFGSALSFDFQKGDELISFYFNWVINGTVDGLLEKDPGEPVIHEVNGTTYYITTNMGKYQAMWTCGKINCYIFVGYDNEELYKMLDSIP